MKNFIFLIFTFYSLATFAQDLTCEDFNEGTFIGTTPQFPDVEWKIIRAQNHQTETPTKVPQKYIDMGMPMDTVYGKFEVIENCTYRFFYDEAKMKLDESQTVINQSGGVEVKVKNIDGKCFFYQSKSILNGKEFVIEGKICKEE